MTDEEARRALLIYLGARREPTSYKGRISWHEKFIYQASAFFSRHDVLRDLIILFGPIVMIALCLYLALFVAVEIRP